MTTSWKASPSSTRHKDRTAPIFDSSVSSLLGEIDEMLVASSSAKTTQQQPSLFTEDMTPISSATPSRSLNNQLQVSLASATTNGNGIHDHHHHQQHQQQFLTRPIAVTLSSNSNGGTPQHHYYHQHRQQHQQSPQELFLSSPSPIRHHHQDDNDHDHDNNDSSRTVIRSSCPNPETLQQASSLFHYRAWSRLEWHAKTQIINFDDQDPVGYFLEGYSCFQQFLNSSSSSSSSMLSVSKRQELLDKSILSFGKCLVLLSQIEGCDLNTVVWEQLSNSSSFENDQNNNNNNNEGDFTVGDVMNLVQMLEEQQKDFAVLATANYQNQNQNQPQKQNSILASHRSLDTQEQHDIERKRQQMKEASPPRVVPLPSASTSSPPDDEEKQTPATTTPKPFKDFRNKNTNTGGDGTGEPGMKNTNNSPNYNNFLEDFIESSLANSEEKLIAYQDKMMGTTTTPRAERMRMLKKLRSNGEIDELNEELQKSRSSKTPTADFLARQRGENTTSAGNQQQEKQQRSSPVQDLNPDQLAKNNVDEQQQPFYMKPITIPTWLLILLVVLSYLGVRSLTSSTSTSSQPPPQQQQKAEQQSSSSTSSTTSNNNNQNEAENVMKNEQKQTSNDGGSSSKPNKKKRFGFW